MVQTTFTKQKRELAKALALVEKLRSQEVRQILFAADGTTELEVTRDSYVDFLPEKIVAEVLASAVKVVHEHGMRQQANSLNKGKFIFEGIEEELSVPQLRAIQDVIPLLTELTNRLPRRNPRVVPNTTINDRPAFAHAKKEVVQVKSRYIPFEEDTTTRVRTYEENYEEIRNYTQTIEVDYGLPYDIITRMQQLVADLSTAVQCAIDDANTRGQKADEVIDRVIQQIAGVFHESLGDIGSP